MGNCCSTSTIQDDSVRPPAPTPVRGRDFYTPSPAPRTAFELEHVNVSPPSTTNGGGLVVGGAARRPPEEREMHPFPRMSFSATSHQGGRNSQSSSDPPRRDSHDVASTISDHPPPKRPRGPGSVNSDDLAELTQSVASMFPMPPVVPPPPRPPLLDEDRRGRSMDVVRVGGQRRDHARARKSERARSNGSGRESVDTRER